MPYRTCHFLRPIDDQVLAFDVAYEEDKISVAPDTSPRSWSCLTFWAWSFVNIDKFSPTNQKLKHGLRVIIWQDIPFSLISRKFVNMQFFFMEIYQATKKLICYPYLGFAVGKTGESTPDTWYVLPLKNCFTGHLNVFWWLPMTTIKNLPLRSKFKSSNLR